MDDTIKEYESITSREEKKQFLINFIDSWPKSNHPFIRKFKDDNVTIEILKEIARENI